MSALHNYNNSLPAYGVSERLILKEFRTRRKGGLIFAALHRAPRALVIGGKNHWAVIGDGDGVLVVGRGSPVTGDNSPTVTEGSALIGAHGDHRLDREHHPRLELNAAPAPAVVADLGVLVHRTADAMTDVVADDSVAI